MLRRFLHFYETKILSNHMRQCFIHNRTENKCLVDKCKISPFKVSKMLVRGQQRVESAIYFERIQLGEHLATNQVN